MTKLEIAARHSLEAFGELAHAFREEMNIEYATTESPDPGYDAEEYQKAIASMAALREALAEQTDEIDWIETNKALAKEIIELKKQAEQEPVGYLCEASFGRGQVFWFNKPADNTPLYAAPVRTKDLTDDEAQKLWNDTSSIVPMWAHHLHFARAVIAADREKNHG